MVHWHFNIQPLHTLTIVETFNVWDPEVNFKQWQVYVLSCHKIHIEFHPWTDSKIGDQTANSRCQVEALVLSIYFMLSTQGPGATGLGRHSYRCIFKFQITISMLIKRSCSFHTGKFLFLASITIPFSFFGDGCFRDFRKRKKVLFSLQPQELSGVKFFKVSPSQACPESLFSSCNYLN